MSRWFAQMRTTSGPIRRQPQNWSVPRPHKTPGALRPTTVLTLRALVPHNNQFHTNKPSHPINTRRGRDPLTSSSLLIPTHRQHISSTTMGSVAAPPKDPAGFQIRKAAAADSEALAALGAKVFRATFAHSCTEEQLQAFLDEAYTPEAIAKDIADGSKDVLVATEDSSSSNSDDGSSSSPSTSGGGGGRLLGFTYLTRGSSEPCVAHLESTVELQRLYIGLDAHGKGIGKALSQAVDALARQQGFKTIWLGVWEENHKAQAFYRKMGYERIGEHVFDVGGDLQTDEIWWKAL
ncbi:hypothetical protein diail_4513 [Diaporthe ilicicola]|nr:hypothetical protein diail_4513 [Diaporthe ilicicola]